MNPISEIKFDKKISLDKETSINKQDDFLLKENNKSTDRNIKISEINDILKWASKQIKKNKGYER